MAGVITAATLAPVNAADDTIVPQLLASVTGWALGDGAYWRPTLRANLAADGLALLAPRAVPPLRPSGGHTGLSKPDGGLRPS